MFGVCVCAHTPSIIRPGLALQATHECWHAPGSTIPYHGTESHGERPAATVQQESDGEEERESARAAKAFGGLSILGRVSQVLCRKCRTTMGTFRLGSSQPGFRSSSLPAAGSSTPSGLVSCSCTSARSHSRGTRPFGVSPGGTSGRPPTAP